MMQQCQRTRPARFNPVLGFLSVSTAQGDTDDVDLTLFQSRAGFSECLDFVLVTPRSPLRLVSIPCWVF